jgi:hypothetical protein
MQGRKIEFGRSLHPAGRDVAQTASPIPTVLGPYRPHCTDRHTVRRATWSSSRALVGAAAGPSARRPARDNSHRSSGVQEFSSGPSEIAPSPNPRTAASASRHGRRQGEPNVAPRGHAKSCGIWTVRDCVEGRAQSAPARRVVAKLLELCARRPGPSVSSMPRRLPCPHRECLEAIHSGCLGGTHSRSSTTWTE